MRYAVLLIIVLFFFFGIQFVPDPGEFSPDGLIPFKLGFLILVTFLAGEFLALLKFPRITGYILTGIFIGPYAFNFIEQETLLRFNVINDLALTFIALNAGGELRLKELKQRKKSIISLVVIIIFGVSSVVFLTFFLASRLFSFSSGMILTDFIGAAILVGVMSTARSPSSAIAIITECRARGPFTETILGVTVALDVITIVLFAFAISFVSGLVVPGTSFNIIFLSGVIFSLVISILIGIVIGYIVYFYIKRIKVDTPVLLIGLAFLITKISGIISGFSDDIFHVEFHLEPMLIAMCVGFYVQNFTKQGPHFITALEKGALPVFVVFFTITGASLDLSVLKTTWLIAVIIVIARGAALIGSGYTAGKIAGDIPVFKKLYGISFLTQAGVSLGLALEISNRIPTWGSVLTTIVIAVITINQIIGPVAMKFSLIKSGETHQSKKR